MAKQPPRGDDRPAIPPPSAEALRRAAPLFAQLVGLSRQDDETATAGSAQALGTAPGDVQPPQQQRRYPLAARLLDSTKNNCEADDVDAELLPEEAVEPSVAMSVTEPRARVGFVRKSAPKAQLVPQPLLEDLAQLALFDEGGAHQDASFMIFFREELLGELQCRIEILAGGGVQANFIATDSSTLMLLRQHESRLRQQLEAKGLHHVAVRIDGGG